MLVHSKDCFNQTKYPNLEPNTNLANRIHSAKHISTWFMARKCLNCGKVNRYEGFSEGVRLNWVGGVEDEISATFHTKLGHLGTVKVVVGAMVIKSRLASWLCSQRPMQYL